MCESAGSGVVTTSLAAVMTLADVDGSFGCFCGCTCEAPLVVGCLRFFDIPRPVRSESNADRWDCAAAPRRGRRRERIDGRHVVSRSTAGSRACFHTLFRDCNLHEDGARGTNPATDATNRTPSAPSARRSRTLLGFDTQIELFTTTLVRARLPSQHPERGHADSDASREHRDSQVPLSLSGRLFAVRVLGRPDLPAAAHRSTTYMPAQCNVTSHTGNRCIDGTYPTW